MNMEDIKTREDLAEFWQTAYPPTCGIVEFYGHEKKRAREKACFSNFYKHSEIPFTIPDCCWVPLDDAISKQQTEKNGTGENELSLPPRTTNVTFSEKSIMLCKAAVMGDCKSYLAIMRAKSPREAKRLGRQVQNFVEEIWRSVILTVAFEAVYQKFMSFATNFDEENEEYQAYVTLLKTKNALLVEAAPLDGNWGIGKGLGHPNCQDPRTWRDGNVLGWALTKARNTIRQSIHTNKSQLQRQSSK